MSSSRSVRAFLARTLLLVVPIVLTVPLFPPAASAESASPELPRLLVDTTLLSPTGIVIPVGIGGDWQAAVDTARHGDVVELQASATFTGNFPLPNKLGTGCI